MKTIDPSIKIGGALDNTDYTDKVLAIAGNSMDFLSIHCYPAYGGMEWDDYLGRSQLDTTLQSVESRIQKAPISEKKKQAMRIQITETGPISFSKNHPWDRDDTGRGLFIFNQIGEAIAYPRCDMGLMWTTHYRWDGKPGGPTDFALDQANNATALGKALGMWQHALLPQWVSITGSGRTLRTWASVDKKNKKLAVVLLNKWYHPQAISLSVNGCKSVSIVKGETYSGKTFDDPKPVIGPEPKAKITGNTLSMTLPANSITILNCQTTE